jgi:hypothetical protein
MAEKAWGKLPDGSLLAIATILLSMAVAKTASRRPMGGPKLSSPILQTSSRRKRLYFHDKD